MRSILSVIAALALGPAASANDFFEKNIRPLLVEKCQNCHGPKKQESGLRVDSRSALLHGGESGPAIVPGKIDAGTLLLAVRGQGERQMPPKEKLSRDQIAALTKWIADGAPWPEATSRATATAGLRHWAFQPVPNRTPPGVRDSAWPLTDIDRFVLARLEKEGLAPVGLADPTTLLRRVTFDLTGLPPTPGEIDAFLADHARDPNHAYDRVIDRLLASPHYGERWGRHWLDVARYADTAGDGADYPVREARLYRDWVISAFNSDLPFDQFVREQIAGDILARSGPPDRYASRVIATGFLAIGKRFGYNPSPDFQHLDFADAIDSLGRSLLGLSLGCARCHDHKYDPVSMNDYYGLYGIFQSTHWTFPGGEEHKKPARLVALVPPDEASRLERAKADELARLDAEIRRLSVERASLDGRKRAGGVDLDFEAQTPGKPPGSPWLAIGPNTVHVDAQSPFRHAFPPGKQGVRMGTGLKTDGIRYVFDAESRPTPKKPMHFTVDFRTVAPASSPGAYRFYLGRGVIESLAVEFSVTGSEFAIRNGTTWEVIRKVDPGTWYTLQVSLDPEKKRYSGVVGRPGDLTLIRDKALNPAWDGIADTFICDGIGHVAGPAPNRDLDNIGLREAPFPAPGSSPVAAFTPSPEAKARISRIEVELAALKKKREAEANREAYPVAYGLAEGKPVNARIQKRGEPSKPGPEVPRRSLTVLGGDPISAESASGRRDLAEWITRPTNPLTARVFVNRVWQWHFGRGLVATPSDFGTRGEPPSHPELLDYLASRFISSGWSVKALHRLILRSRVYRLASDDLIENSRIDPNNILLWRHSRRPLDAESIRDAMLAVSGRLDRSPPGAHPFPPVGTWGFTIHNPFHALYETDRRSVYLMVQRNRRHPYLALFDAADPNLSVAERISTTTPTQALYLMNSPFVHEQSEALARRILADERDDFRRIHHAFLLAHGKPPSETEKSEAIAFLSQYRMKLAESGVPTDRQPQAAWAALARVMMTSNAFLYVD